MVLNTFTPTYWDETWPGPDGVFSKTLDQKYSKMERCLAAYKMLGFMKKSGPDAFLGEALELVQRIAEGKHHVNHPHVLFPLMGWFKVETGECPLTFCLANQSNSGIPNRKWLERLARLLRMEGRHREAGPAFCDLEGFVISTSALNKELHQVLSNLQMSRLDLIAPDIVVTEAYNVYRSFRQGATTQT